MLALLWSFSALGGWGTAAFCGDPGQRDLDCADHYDLAVLLSVPLAAAAAALATAAWLTPAVRRSPDRLDALLTTAALLWVAAEAVLFVGGYLAQP